MAENHVEIMRNVYGNLAKGDLPAVLATFDAEIHWTEAEGFPYGGVYTGPEEVAEKVFMRLGTEWDGFSVQPAEFVDAGDKVVVMGKYRGTYKATGKDIDAHFAHVWTLRNGKAVKFVQYTDTALVQQALEG
jgi:ketosteroid isomerase-like protein